MPCGTHWPARAAESPRCMRKQRCVLCVRCAPDPWGPQPCYVTDRGLAPRRMSRTQSFLEWVFGTLCISAKPGSLVAPAKKESQGTDQASGKSRNPYRCPMPGSSRADAKRQCLRERLVGQYRPMVPDSSSHRNPSTTFVFCSQQLPCKARSWMLPPLSL